MSIIKKRLKIEKSGQHPDSISFSDRTRQIITSEKGSISIFGLLLLTMILAAAGLAVDLLNFETHRTRLQNTLDRAVLAATNMSQTLDPKDVILDYFDKAGLEGYVDSNDITVEETNTYRRVSAIASMSMSTSFLRLMGTNSLTASAESSAEESVSQTEISLVLDVSGSMGSYSYSAGQSKISELRDAATQFVNIMQCDPENPDSTSNCVVEEDQVSISVVPYAEQVLVGENLLDQFNATSEQTDSSCVTFDDADFQSTEVNTTDEIQRTGHFDPWSSSRYSPGSWTCRTDSWREILPVTHDSDTLRTKINSLGASGNTSIDIGMKWGTALLDPGARDAITGMIADGETDENVLGRPYDWTKRGISKVIVLMTDGVNTYEHYLNDGYREGPSEIWYNSDANVYSVYYAPSDEYYWMSGSSSRHSSGSMGWYDHPYGDGSYENCSYSYSYYYGYRYTCSTVEETGSSTQLTFPELWAKKPTSWYSQFSWLGNPVSYNASSAKDARLLEICDAAKDKGVVIFSIGFEVSSSAGTVLQTCATSPSHYFDVSGLELTTAFHSIAREISKLRLTQ